ncbi:hypothetical protein CBOM_07414 [Ceraceosorus bombacis]|uniref:Uncharacterized protein n=1 Tax=Ceraceosorus bombacis TaxID=401625 RepID=A0A0P1BB31_9BASI|nr:hypothetical protein CBOM_07414 [Ceraceosorus bombacis]
MLVSPKSSNTDYIAPRKTSVRILRAANATGLAQRESSRHRRRRIGVPLSWPPATTSVALMFATGYTVTESVDKAGERIGRAMEPSNIRQMRVLLLGPTHLSRSSQMLLESNL